LFNLPDLPPLRLSPRKENDRCTSEITSVQLRLLRVNRYRSFAVGPDAKSALTQKPTDSNAQLGGDPPAEHASQPATQPLHSIIDPTE
jgi:hypothetical protein